jgi:hypothetical protein
MKVRDAERDLYIYVLNTILYARSERWDGCLFALILKGIDREVIAPAAVSP